MAVSGLVLLAAWFSPVLRPSVVGTSGGGSSTGLPTTSQVLTTTLLAPAGWPSLTVESVETVPGAVVSGAWLVPASAVESHPSTTDDLGVLDVAAATFPSTNLDEAQLPQRVHAGDKVQLVIAWSVTDCAVLDPTTLPVVVLRSALGQHRTEELPEWSGPDMIDGGSRVCPRASTSSVDEAGW